jgi:choline dehydrogenase-like flavoprotein
MILDATAAGTALFERRFDACVIGAGPAGITLARRLAARGFSVALMEAGGLEISEASQEIYQGEVTGLDYYPLDVARLRYFGGTSNHWGGWCRELDASDFAPRPDAPLSGWPIGKADLDPYQAETDAILDLPPPPGWDDLPIPPAGRDFRHLRFRYSPPTRFGEKFRDEIAASDRISLALNANLVDLRLAGDPGAGPGGASEGGVSEAVFATYPPEMRRFAVRAQVFCLCAGGLENPRLLLNFTSQAPEGIGNRNDMVGRCFCEHPHFVLADLLLEAPKQEKEFYGPTGAFMAAEGVLNFGLRLEPARRPPPLSFLRSLRRSAVCASSFTEELGARVFGRSFDCDQGGLGEYFARLTAEEPLTGEVRIASEQRLDRESRVRLGAARDVFGMRRIALDWRLSPEDVATMRTAVTAFGAFIAEAGIGRLRVRDWLLAERPLLPGIAEDEVGGFHHMCTTRMSANPADGVVDAQCRVHGVPNLYVGGSSVFATPGHANPTYTIVQLALRLGDHLATVVPRA